MACLHGLITTLPPLCTLWGASCTYAFAEASLASVKGHLNKILLVAVGLAENLRKFSFEPTPEELLWCVQRNKSNHARFILVPETSALDFEVQKRTHSAKQPFMDSENVEKKRLIIRSRQKQILRTTYSTKKRKCQLQKCRRWTYWSRWIDAEVKDALNHVELRLSVRTNHSFR